MKKSWTICVLMLALGLAAPTMAEQDGYQWNQIKEKEGITLYASKTPDSDFTTYKATGIVNKPWEVVFEVLLDVEAYPKWMPGCRQAKIITMLDEPLTKGNFAIHLVWDALWPVKNRDLVVRVDTVRDWKNDHVVVTLNQTDEFYVPLAPGLRRVDRFFARFDFRYIDRTHCMVEYVHLVDPGGVVTPWMARLQTATVPFDTLKALGERAEDPMYYKRAMENFF